MGSNTTRFLQRVQRGSLGPFAPPGSLSVVGVQDAAAGICLALERGRANGRYLLSESNWTHVELLALAATELGVPPPRWRVPKAAWSAVVAAAALVDRVLPATEATPEALRLLGTHFRFDAARARSELGWRPRPFPEVLRETVRWMRSTDPS
jgi:dihydroflavonol-4-reductase